jgi:adenylate cyclase
MQPDPNLSSHDAIAEWLVLQGVYGTSQEDLLEGYCTRILQAGLPVQRVHVAQRAYHPEYGGFGYNWQRDAGMERDSYEHTDAPLDVWLASPLYYLLSVDEADLRISLEKGDPPARFPFLSELKERGCTDYFAAKVSFEQPRNSLATNPDDPAEGLMMSWTSDSEGGFSDSDLAMLRRLLPYLGLALKSASNRQMASDIVQTYLGADAGERVLSGDIVRGSSETIHAVIWYFDLRGFTKLSERIAGHAVIDMLNDYFGEVVGLVEGHGGNVLKFMGDGLLAIFDCSKDAGAVDNALEAAIQVGERMAAVSARRAEEGLTTTDYSLSLHLGDVLYGNIGGKARLDFTVIGAAVNQTARIQGMCGPLDRNFIMSAQVARQVTTRKAEVISLGPYMLRGVEAPQELFTLYLGSE